jgi:2'-5' RNA ligase
MRLFIGFEPADNELRALYECRESLPLDPQLPVRWVPEDNWHVTLLFLGEVADHALAALSEILEAAASRCVPFALALTSLEWFPHSTKARLLALCADASGPLLSLHDELAGQLRRENFHIERRQYRPHLTLARRHGPRKAFAAPALPSIEPLALQLAELVLFESVLGGEHPRYQALQRFRLSP